VAVYLDGIALASSVLLLCFDITLQAFYVLLNLLITGNRFCLADESWKMLILIVIALQRPTVISTDFRFFVTD
jgi:hypothetical protein